ncbi:MAG TPA: hypothetical protein VFN97_21415, partial [Actinospica sp.]|nr:hypothetical protein [Actinospica sp.]
APAGRTGNFRRASQQRQTEGNQSHDIESQDPGGGHGARHPRRDHGGYYSYYAGPINGPGYPVCAEAYFKMDDSGGNQIVSYQTKIYCD